MIVWIPAPDQVRGKLFAEMTIYSTVQKQAKNLILIALSKIIKSYRQQIIDV